MVERCVRDAEVAGSNPVISTMLNVHNGFELWTLDFFAISSFFVMYGAGFRDCSFVLCGFGNILDGYTFSAICLVITFAFGYLNIPNEFVMDHNPLTAIFTNTFGFINRYFVYEFANKRCRNFCKPAVRPLTQQNYENRIYDHIISEIGKIPLNKLSQNDLQQFYARLKKNGLVIRWFQEVKDEVSIIADTSSSNLWGQLLNCGRYINIRLRKENINVIISKKGNGELYGSRFFFKIQRNVLRIKM